MYKLRPYFKKNNFKVIFISRDFKGNLINTIEEDFEVFRLDDVDDLIARKEKNLYLSNLGCSQESDALETIKILRSNKITNFEYLIVDHYSLDKKWEMMIKKEFCKEKNYKSLIIDDINNRFHICDLILDQNVINSYNPYSELVEEGTQFLLGPYFALLSREYSLVKKLSKSKKDKKRIVVFFGGVDKNNLTFKVVKILTDSFFDNFNIEIVVGRNNLEIKNLKKIIESRTNFNIHIQLKSLAKLISDAELVIGGGGVNSWERECLEVPSLLISLSENQIKVAKNISTKGRVNYLGHFDKVNSDQIKINIINEINNGFLKTKPGNFVDGFGTNRVAILLTGIRNFLIRKTINTDHLIINFWLSTIKTKNIKQNKFMNKDFFKFIITDIDDCPLFVFSYLFKNENLLEVECLYDQNTLDKESGIYLFKKGLISILIKEEIFSKIKLRILNEIEKESNGFIKSFLKENKFISYEDEFLFINYEKNKEYITSILKN